RVRRPSARARRGTTGAAARVSRPEPSRAGARFRSRGAGQVRRVRSLPGERSGGRHPLEGVAGRASRVRRCEGRPPAVAPGLGWAEADPELVLVHGGAQNAHTWDTVALALDRPLVAVDLPGHGHSDWREDRRYWPADNAEELARVLPVLAPSPRLVVGMSLGG